MVTMTTDAARRLRRAAAEEADRRHEHAVIRQELRTRRYRRPLLATRHDRAYKTTSGWTARMLAPWLTRMTVDHAHIAEEMRKAGGTGGRRMLTIRTTETARRIRDLNARTAADMRRT